MGAHCFCNSSMYYIASSLFSHESPNIYILYIYIAIIWLPYEDNYINLLGVDKSMHICKDRYGNISAYIDIVDIMIKVLI